MKLNIVEKALLWQNNGFYLIGHIILSIFEIPKDVMFKQIGGLGGEISTSCAMLSHPSQNDNR